MGKRSDFERRDRDFYETWDTRAVIPLGRHLKMHTMYHEPCAGNGALIDNLSGIGAICTGANDIEPGRVGIDKLDALKLDRCVGQMFITNPPWLSTMLLPLVDHLTTLAPTWMLLSADFMHNEYRNEAKRLGVRPVSQIMRHCRIIQAVGRVQWMRDSDNGAKDNCCWYLFDKIDTLPGNPVFFPKVAID